MFQDRMARAVPRNDIRTISDKAVHNIFGPKVIGFHKWRSPKAVSAIDICPSTDKILNHICGNAVTIPIDLVGLSYAFGLCHVFQNSMNDSEHW